MEALWLSLGLPLAAIGLLGCHQLMALGGWMWEAERWTDISHKSLRPEALQEPPAHGCTNAAGGGAAVESLQRELGGSSIEAKRREKRRKQEKTRQY